METLSLSKSSKSNSSSNLCCGLLILSGSLSDKLCMNESTGVPGGVGVLGAGSLFIGGDIYCVGGGQKFLQP